MAELLPWPGGISLTNLASFFRREGSSWINKPTQDSFSPYISFAFASRDSK